MDDPSDGVPFGVRSCMGLKGGELFTNGDGFFYAKQYSKGQGRFLYLVCKTRLCRGSAKLVSGVLHICKPHSVGCQPDHLFEQTTELRRQILRRCEEETRPLQRIFNEECNRVPPEVAATLSYPSILSSLKRARRKRVPQIPQTYEEFEVLLAGRFEDADGTRYEYKRIGEGDNQSVVFIVTPIEGLLQESEEWHLDGTFKVVPNIPASRQLFSILAMKEDHAFPVVMALMKNKSATAYTTILDYLKDKYQTINPKLIISDFESGIKTAVKSVFPESIHKGCWFHFSQSIFRRIQSHGFLYAFNNNAQVKKTIRMLMALALLPAANIQEGYEAIKNYAEDHNITEVLHPLFLYFEHQWIGTVGCASFSVYGQPRRTNNCQESFHHTLFNTIGKAHPNIWEFTEGIREVASSATRDIHRLATGGRLAFMRKRKWLLQDRQILHCQTQFILQRITSIEFLAAMANRICSHEALSTIGDDVDVELTPLPDQLQIHAVPTENNNELDEERMEIEVPVRVTGRLHRNGRTRNASRRNRGRGGIPQAVLPDELLAPLPAERTQSTYENYRIVPIKLNTNFMDDSDIEKQKTEIELGLNSSDEGISNPNNGDAACVCCLTAKATRMASPCGHMVSCRPCAVGMVNQPLFHEVTAGDGSIITTHIRLPLTCPVCRAIIGLMVRTF